ncbi:MAG: NEW3 domain-containing protein [Deltaproteobacteria bacterium]|nr:NEW3 domain-containing protein [Deltaproteobacteria bacterium]
MGHGRGRKKSFAVAFILVGLLAIAPLLALAAEAEKKDNRPERGIALYTDYTAVSVARGETVQMELILENKGRTDENIDVRIVSAAKDWKASLKGARYQVSGMYVPEGKSKTLALTLEPAKGVGPGKYQFQFEGKTADGKFTVNHALTVNVQERTAGADNIQVTAAYPVLRGQTDSKFEFSLDVLNKGDVERTFNLAATGPEKWEINFKPAYEQKQISSIRVKDGASQTVAVEVTPPQNANSGDYPILVRISAGDTKADVRLMVTLTGTYKLDAGTPNGILSLDAVGGKPVTFSLFVRNSGSAINRNISFSSFKPENWETKFNPEKIEALAPGEMKQVEVTVTPGRQSLVGDYSVGVMATGEKSDKTVEMRVTVKASSAWGWIGIGIILLVIAGLSFLFIKMGRR